MDGQIFLTVIGTGISVIGFIYMFLRNFKIDMKTDIGSIKTDIGSIKTDIISIRERLAGLESLEKIASEERIARKMINLIQEDTQAKKQKAKGE